MIFASNNKGKINQIKKLFGDEKVFSLKEFGLDVDVKEDGNSCSENAILKAVEIHKMTKEAVLSDDSGLFITEFNGWPGVLTHRFLGENSTARERNLFILEKMKHLPHEKRQAKFMCVFALCDKNGKVTLFEGETISKIGFQVQGENSFGFDEIFEVEEGKTFAELSDEQKIEKNARGEVFKKMKCAIENGLFVE